MSSSFLTLPGFSVHGISQARILEWVASSFSRGSSRPRDQTQVSHNASMALVNISSDSKVLRANHLSTLKDTDLQLDFKYINLTSLDIHSLQLKDHMGEG